MNEIQRKMLHHLSRAGGNYLSGAILAARCNSNITSIKYHAQKLRHRVESQMGRGGGYKLR